MKILIIGNGFIGKRCADAWSDAVVSDTNIQATDDVLKILEEHQPDAVLNAVGVVGKPNVDWCEDHALETVVGNTKLPIMVAEACQSKGVYLLHIGTGCVFYGRSPEKDGWREDDFGNPVPVYTRSKWAADLVLSTLPNVGIARIRMPIDWMPGTANLIDKITKYKQLIDVENSVTIVDDMVDVFYELLSQKATGIFHVVNPGILQHREIIALYEKLVDPSHTNEWISDEELVKRGLAKKGRSSVILQSNNLEQLGIMMREVHEALEDTMRKYTKMKKSL